jgi:hypothetical protein
MHARVRGKRMIAYGCIWVLVLGVLVFSGAFCQMALSQTATTEPQVGLHLFSTLFMWAVGGCFATIGALIGVVYATLRRELSTKQSVTVCDKIVEANKECMRLAQVHSDKNIELIRGDFKDHLIAIQRTLQLIEYFVRPPTQRQDGPSGPHFGE